MGIALPLVGTPAPAREADGWMRLVCRAAWDETKDVRTFLLASEAGDRIDFDPGQFMTFRMQIDGETVERCYSLSSSAAVAGTVAITVKRKPGGRMSGRLHADLRPGGRIDAFGPAGRFGLGGGTDGARLLLVSAGSGVTPIASILRTAADLGRDLDVVCVHAARTPADVIFADDFAGLKRRLPRLRVLLAASRPDDGWPGLRGRLDDGLVRAVPDLAARRVLCCGPEGFMATVRGIVSAVGVPDAAYLEESFNFDAIDEPPPVVAASAPARRITFARSGRSFDCAPGQSILQAAKAAGVPMPSSCAKGMCGTCKSRKLSGSVTMKHQGGIRQREIDAGLILPCSSRPDTDVTLDR
jgi:3-phenylpropionate/trans-cinnamate dioxygenase ferredoxin reductase subunit